MPLMRTAQHAHNARARHAQHARAAVVFKKGLARVGHQGLKREPSAAVLCWRESMNGVHEQPSKRKTESGEYHLSTLVKACVSPSPLAVSSEAFSDR
jgi:hypothetical protein